MTTAALGPMLLGAHRNATTDDDNGSYWVSKTNALALALLMTKEPEVRPSEIAKKTTCILKALDDGALTRGEIYAALDSGSAANTPRRNRRTF